MSLHARDVKRFSLKVTGEDWIAVIFTDGGIGVHDGTRTMPSRIVEDVINTLAKTLPYSTHGRYHNLAKPGMTGYSGDTTK
jgi:hypothetical protein